MRADLASSLLRVAEDLAALDARGKPREASLRRAVSTAYYALFHLLVNDALHCGLQNDEQRRSIGPVVGREFTHKAMDDELRKLLQSQPGNRTGFLQAIVGQVALDPDLIEVCQWFRGLRDERERADYDRGARFLRTEVTNLVARTKAAFAAWSRAFTTPQGRQVALLLFLTCRSRRY